MCITVAIVSNAIAIRGGLAVGNPLGIVQYGCL